jgi:hypothetical protein
VSTDAFPEPGPTSAPWSRARSSTPWLLLPIVLALALVTYRAALDAPLGSDARFLTYRNTFVTQPGADGLARMWTSDVFGGAETHGVPYRSGYYRPVLNTIFWLEYRWAGERDVFYNLLEVLLHGLNALLVAFLVGRLTRDPRAGVLAGVLFAVHPVHAFAATEPAARADVLFTLFYLCGLLAFDRLLDRREDASVPWAGLAVVTGLYGLSLLSKEMGATLPAVLVLLVLLRRSRDGGSLRRLTWTIPPWAVLAVYVVWRFIVLDVDVSVMGYGEANGTLALTLAALKTLPIHLSRILLPLGPSFPELNPELVNTVGGGLSDPLAWIAILVTVGMLAGCLLLVGSRPLLGFALAAFIVAFSPLLRVENIGGTLDTGVILTQERWIYLPSVAVFGGVAVGLLAVFAKVSGPTRRQRWIQAAGVGGVVATLAWSASVHAGKHEDPFAQLKRLYQIPEARLGRFEQANKLLLYAHWVALPSGDLADAERRARAALELVPDSPLAARSAAEVLARVGKWEEVRDLLIPWLNPDAEWLEDRRQTNFRVADDWNRVNPEVMLLLGRASAHLGDPGEAHAYLCEALVRGLPVERVREATAGSPDLGWPLSCPG